MVVAVGGDGTLNQTISGLMSLEQRPLLGYLPRGSTNDFAASLHISSDPAAAADQILHGQRRALDIGRWNERYFVYVASSAPYPQLLHRSPGRQDALGHLAYILEGMKDLNLSSSLSDSADRGWGGSGWKLSIRRRVQLHLHRRLMKLDRAGGAG